MRITLDGKIVEAVNRIGSEIWDLADGEVRQLKQDYSAGLAVFTTYAVLKEAEKKVEEVANTVATNVETTVKEVKTEVETEVKDVEKPGFFKKIGDELKDIEHKVEEGIHSVEQKVEDLFKKQ